MLTKKIATYEKIITYCFSIANLGIYQVSYGQEMIDIPITQTGEIIDEESQDTLAISSDDAEQENNEIDALDDDDLDSGWQGQEGDQIY